MEVWKIKNDKIILIENNKKNCDGCIFAKGNNGCIAPDKIMGICCRADNKE